MQYRALGGSGIEASVVGMGTWVTGGGSVWGQEPDDSESIRTIHAALDAGVNLIDTAPLYGFGRSEEVVGKALKGRRDEIVLATKCGLLWDDTRGSFFTEYDGETVYRSLRPDTIAIEIERSLERLGTDRIDLYQTHWPAIEPDKTPIADTMACLMKLKEQGKIRAIGVSNVSLDELEENVAHGEVASDQFRYSMLLAGAENDILPYCREHNIATLTYMSLEQGLLTGKVGMDRTFGEDEWRSNADWNPWFKLENRRRILDLLDGWSDLTGKYNCSLAQLVIAWTAAQPGVTHVLCGARRVEQMEQNAAAADLAIEPGDLARIRRDVEALGQPN
ncbi:MAG: aldo/keto reductase [Candidatus Hydrogenedentes bacterium]|nr:aldo/keto reductase [Candidatus Hydrogenedentota bacterium]